MPQHQISQFKPLDEAARACALRLSNCIIAAERANYQIRLLPPGHHYIEIARLFRLALLEYSGNEDVYPPLNADPAIGSLEWTETWRKIDAILARDASTSKDHFLKYITGSYATTLISKIELVRNPLQNQIIEAASDQASETLLPEIGYDYRTLPQSLPGLLRAREFLNIQVRCKDKHGRILEFFIIDLGTSTNGPWVKYLPINGMEGRDDVTVDANEMYDMLGDAEIIEIDSDSD
ncbi:hypothetical protein AMATHDRAFT_41872 [Amanita thiersii Skay4041]|uniref:Uncharacterized protein n=1 Tax=Amanita thiersii Skay4041 TaxID=703135 RepID=A0A2A9ND56_9AGAR|nr:hypothetical protein AMATHDRAFT_41872 [Amanita thiersii Skay4041]